MTHFVVLGTCLKDKSLHNLRLISSLVIGALLLAAPQGSAKEPAKTYRHAVVIRFEGEIGPGLARYLYRKLDAAKQQGADLVILAIDSGGGELKTSVWIAQYLQKQDWAHTVAYVPEYAISGAAIAALGCDEILIAPHALIGDAGVISKDRGVDAEWRLAPQKEISFLAPALRSLAEAKGRPPALAEALSDKDLKVYHVRDLKDGRTTYISDREFNAAEKGKWEKLGEVAHSGNDRFLGLTGEEAVEVGFADALIDSRGALADRFGLGVDDLHVMDDTALDMAVLILNSLLVTGLLLIVGLIGLYMEAMAPGHGVGGLVAAACFLLLFWSHFLGGTADWLEVVLFLVGLACVGVEIFLLPGTVVPGLTGAALILVSVVMASQGFLVPETPRQLHTLEGTLAMLVVSCGIFVAAAVVITRRMESLPLLNRLTLAPPGGESAAEKASAAEAATGLAVGDVGIAHTPLRPGGKGRFGELLIDVLASGDFFDRGTPIRVVRVTGNQVLVEGVEEQT
jgi:membrane-bound serine protease (ClpP class)